MTQEYLQDIRSVVIDYLREMDIKYPTNFDHDYEFERYYVETAIQHGFPAELVLSKEFEIALRVGIDIALTTYGWSLSLTSISFDLTSLWQDI